MKITARTLKSHRVIAKSCDYKTRFIIGAKIIKYLNTNGLREKLQNQKWNKFYILKEDFGNLRKGESTFSIPKCKHRIVNFIEDKETRKLLGKLSKCMEIPHKMQIGFVSKRSIKDIQKHTNDAKSALMIDLKGAFDQIKADEVKFIIWKTLKVNEKDAEIITNSMCKNGYMVQGHPLSPTIFNLIAFGLINRLNKVSKAVQYADDITIFSKYYYISWKYIRMIKKIILEEEWVINNSKTQIRKKVINTLGMTLKLIENKFRCKGFSRRKRSLNRQLGRLNLLRKEEIEYIKPQILGNLFWTFYQWGKETHWEYDYNINLLKIKPETINKLTQKVI